MRYAAAVDANQKDIVKALRQIGCSVQPLHNVGNGVPDLLVGVNSLNLLIEVKDGSKSPSDQKLTTDQGNWHDAWRGQVQIINSVDKALALIHYVRSK